MWQMVCACIFFLLMLIELYCCNVDLEYEDGEETMVKSTVRPYSGNFQTFLFSFRGNLL